MSFASAMIKTRFVLGSFSAWYILERSGHTRGTGVVDTWGSSPGETEINLHAHKRCSKLTICPEISKRKMTIFVCCGDVSMNYSWYILRNTPGTFNTTKSSLWIAQTSLLTAFRSSGDADLLCHPTSSHLYRIPHVTGAQMIFSAVLWWSLKRNVCAANVQERRAACGQALH